MQDTGRVCVVCSCLCLQLFSARERRSWPSVCLQGPRTSDIHVTTCRFSSSCLGGPAKVLVGYVFRYPLTQNQHVSQNFHPRCPISLSKISFSGLPCLLPSPLETAPGCRVRVLCCDITFRPRYMLTETISKTEATVLASS